MTNIAKIAKITNVTKFETQKNKEAKKGPEMSANIVKIAKVTRIFLANRKKSQK